MEVEKRRAREVTYMTDVGLKEVDLALTFFASFLLLQSSRENLMDRRERHQKADYLIHSA